MCTVTVVPVKGGFRLSCNRDEKRERVTAEAPAVRTLKGRRAIFPVDPIGPGTWVGVNDAGLAAALLNRTTASTAPGDQGRRTSRGVIIPMLLDCASLDGALEICTALNPNSFGAFGLIVIQKSATAVVTSDGLRLSIELAALLRPVMLTSSSLGDDVVEGARRRLFERLFACHGRSWKRAQRRFHRHRWRSRPEISVLMERADAKTVSHTAVEVNERTIRLTYQDAEWNQTTAVRIAIC